MNKLKRDIRSIIKILINNNVTIIYPTKITQLLQCPIEAVEDILWGMVEEEILEHMLEIHCADCGEIMDSFESTRFLSSAPFPCPHCGTQMESNDMNETVSAFYPIKQNLV
ncbi:hypothetical protein [Desulfoscipio gibsoniae]|uniref:Uncharacterized protein n=1 Tax=Desulfoscipio gibsoniae DSM 7213 TaxID=767817 RepID=R4KMN8_9FIRM|nr:hypothetical protein [Desulfoscipio gibsoniae]AGL00976.1 hypothetical protein Desgi_1489 [Desulfoscipio gibsoniae DSM 7213]AGL02827.1 hypothetical protein Desgi_3496 [Desulfoscipio gibsoniae DSM 7213]